MPWEVALKRRDGQPIATIEDFRETLPQILPGLQFYREPSGKEKMAAVKIEFPEFLRNALANAPAQIQADFEADGLFLRFFFGPEESPRTDHVDIEVRGNGNPLPHLSAIARGLDCVVVERSGDELPLTGNESPEWQKFAQWRDRTIEKIKSEPRG